MRAVTNLLRTVVVMALLSGSLVGFSGLVEPVLSAAESSIPADQGAPASIPESPGGSRNAREGKGHHPIRKACADDVKKFCSDVKAGQGRIAQCLKQHTQDLSHGCADTMQQRGKH